MPYASQADMVGRFGEDEIIQLTDQNGAGAIDTDVLNSAIEDAEAEVNAYISKRYATPMTDPIPGLITRMTCDIARYFLHDDGTSEEVDKRYERAVKFLKSVGIGQADIPGVNSTTGSAISGGPYAVKTNTDRIFTMESLSQL